MRKKSIEVRLIGYGLSIVFGVGLCIYLATFLLSIFNPQEVLRSPVYAGKFASIADFQKEAVVFFILYFPQFIGFMAVARYQEWGRKLVILAGSIMVLYAAWQMTAAQKVDSASLATMFVYIAVVLFFVQINIRFQFRKDIKQKDKTILVVDDDKTLLKMTRVALLNNGYDVLLATTGEQGLGMAKRAKPDLIILDVILPKMKGREVCVKLKDDNRTQDIPVIFLTAKDSPDDVRAEMQVGGVAHLTKPVDSHRLISEITRILG